jgi:hypothetical protein
MYQKKEIIKIREKINGVKDIKIIKTIEKN